MKTKHETDELLLSPAEMRKTMPLDEKTARTVALGRATIRNIISGKDPRLLAIVGPCSMHDPLAALEYAARLARMHGKLADRIFLIMRAYTEKPRSTVGWKGLVNDPGLDGACDMKAGLQISRELLLKINGLGIPLGMELLDPLVDAYLGDLASWMAIGARTVESQTHREIASGLPVPVGFKNNTEGNIGSAVNAMIAAAQPHSFLGASEDGTIGVLRSQGNPLGHLVLRGGPAGPNCDARSIRTAEKLLAHHGLPPAIIVDCSHMNSNKDYRRQAGVCEQTVALRRSGMTAIKGVMLESNLLPGCQPVATSDKLSYGVSITDPCIGWEETEEVLTRIHGRLGRR
jgi:3-deoxy-7-phosphoheptulonate synthase